MTADKFNRLPLLIRRSQVIEVLDGISVSALYDLRAAGTIRVFLPDPSRRFAYYFKADVARQARMPFATDFIERLACWIPPAVFLRHSGLSRRAFDRARETGQLAGVHWRMNGYQKLYRDDLRWFV